MAIFATWKIDGDCMYIFLLQRFFLDGGRRLFKVAFQEEEFLKTQ